MRERHGHRRGGPTCGGAAFSGGAVGLLLGLVGIFPIAAAPSVAHSSAATAKTIVLDVHFSPFAILRLNPAPDPATGLGLGDEITFHDLLFSGGRQVGDEAGACVIVDAHLALASCHATIRLAGGDIAAQFLNAPPPEKQFALTGGTGAYRSAGGDATLVEFGDGTGRLALRLLRLSHRGQGA